MRMRAVRSVSDRAFRRRLRRDSARLKPECLDFPRKARDYALISTATSLNTIHRCTARSRFTPWLDRLRKMNIRRQRVTAGLKTSWHAHMICTLHTYAQFVHLRVGVRPLLLPQADDDVDEAAVVLR